MKYVNFDAVALRILSGAVFVGIGAKLRMLSLPLILLGLLMLIDYGTGLSRAWLSGSLSSRKSIAGILKKVSYLAVVAVGVACDYVIRYGFASAGYSSFPNCAVSVVILVWLIVNEMISILENISEMGVPVPNFLLRLVSRLKVNTENAAEYDDSEKKTENNKREDENGEESNNK